MDSLRAAMMWLGLVLHSAASYLTVSLADAWPYQDRQTSPGLDLLVFLIHLFRMPVFFVVAGFFAAMLYERDGVAGLVRNRVRRVLLPLVLLWPFAFTAVAAGFVYAAGRGAGRVDLSPITTGAYMARASLVHLWFLWYLLIFYAAAVILAPIAWRLPPRWTAAMDRGFGWVATSIVGGLLLSAISTLTLLPMSVPALDTSFSFRPPLRVLVAYGVFFAFGWLLFRRRDLIEPFARRWKLPMLLGTAAATVYLTLSVQRAAFDPPTFHVVACAAGALAMWMLIFGIVGAFVTLLHTAHPAVRYLADASYWIYVVHMAIVIWLHGLLAPFALRAVAKFAITLLATSLVSVLSYHYLVRSTALGLLLNGRRYPRGLPAREPVREVVSV